MTDTKFDALEWLRKQTEAIRTLSTVAFEQAADELEQARAHITELEQTLDLRHKADMRAIERWRAEKPDERELRSPDHADLCVWLLARIAELEAAIQSAYEDAQRGVIERRIGYDKTPCSECRGLGTKVYGSTATWRGGIGGQTITNDVCDRCWGSGDADMPWPSWRKSDAELGDVLKAAREDKLFQELEHRYMTVCADLDRLRSENEALQERLKTAREAADEIDNAVSAISYVAGIGKLLNALSGVRLVEPDEADMAWAKAAHVSARPDASPVVSGEKADRHTQESPAKPKESSDE